MIMTSEELCLPFDLEELYYGSNQITKIENLPTELKVFYCENNQIKKLENLPSGLKTLKCCYNQITKIENLPYDLKILYCSSNEISKLENLPSGLEKLYCSFNQITKLENLPHGLKEIWYYGNPIKYVDWFEDSQFNLKFYNSIKHLQKRMKIRFTLRNKSSISKITLDECSICLCNIQNYNKCKCKVCKKSFHTSCNKIWLNINNKCSHCRSTWHMAHGKYKI